MSTTPTPSTPPLQPEQRCFMRSVAAVFAENPRIEAITLNRAGKTISVATMGASPDVTLEERVRAKIVEAQSAGGIADCTFWGEQTDCGACKMPLQPHEREAFQIAHTNGSITISRVTCPTAPRFWHWRSFPWPKVVQRDVEFIEHIEHLDEWKPQLIAALLCGAFGLAGFLHGPKVAMVCYPLAYLAGGWFTVEEVWERLRKWTIDVHFLMLAVAAGSASIGAWGEGAMLLFLFSLSGALEHFALGRTQREIHALFKDAPKTATVIGAGGREQETPVAELRAGMRLLVKPGSQFPVDVEVASGRTAADESNLTGESAPVDKAPGDTALAGTLNLWGAVEAVVLRPAANSALQKIIHLIREAQHQKAPAQQLADKFGTAYTYSVLLLSLLMFFVWWLGLGLAPFSGGVGPSAFYRTMTLLVVASPCALVLSIPSAVLAAIASGARQGILFRGGAAVEKLAEIHVAALDKTGTLTTGELRVDLIESFPPGREAEVARAAFAIEKLSTHPLARAITLHGKREQLEAPPVDHFESVTGHGVKAEVAGKPFLLGRREWAAREMDPAVLEAIPPALAGCSEVWLAGGGLAGRILLRDDIRPQASVVIGQLRREGVQSIVLTGDRKAAAEKLKTELHLDDVRAELRPEDKLGMIRAFNDAGVKVAMVGDGVNDAPGIAAAHVGVAMGARGSDAALEMADVVLMNDRLENFLTAFRLSQRARRVIRQNLFLSLGTVVVLVLFALAGSIPLTLGVVGHEGSTVVVVMNSLRLLLRNGPGRAAALGTGTK